MILKWLRSSHRMCAARHCPQFATCKQQLTRQHVGGPMNASVFWTVAIPTLSQNIKSKWRGYFKSQMHGHVGKLKVQPQVSKAIPRAAPSVEVLWPKCNAPQIAKPLKAPTLQGFFFKATTAGFSKNRTFKFCNWGPNLLNENIQKFLFLNFFRACQRKETSESWHFQVWTWFTMQPSNCSCCETPFQWNLAFFTLFYMFQFYVQAFLACQNSICLVWDFIVNENM